MSSNFVPERPEEAGALERLQFQVFNNWRSRWVSSHAMFYRFYQYSRVVSPYFLWIEDIYVIRAMAAFFKFSYVGGLDRLGIHCRYISTNMRWVPCALLSILNAGSSQVRSSPINCRPNNNIPHANKISLLPPVNL